MCCCRQCEPLTGRVQKILTWRWKEPPPVDDEMDHVTPHSPNKKQAEMREREFFIKWHDMCYWHSEWISELQVSNERENAQMNTCSWLPLSVF